MAYFKTTWALGKTWALLSVVILAGAAGTARADAAAATAEGTTADAVASQNASALATVEVSASRVAPACDGLTPREARRAAKEAQRNDAHHRAAECFRAAGDHARADHALVRAASDTNAAAREKAEATVETAKLQARRLREAFR